MSIRFSVNDTRWRNRLSAIGRRVRAKAFESQVKRLAKNSLQDAIKLTPVRPLATIRKNQVRQYNLRVNYIPSVHWRSDPMLIVTEDGSHMLKFNGIWLLANGRNLTGMAYSVYMELLDERNRRIQTSRGQFIAERAQARYLYVRSWWQAGRSIGLSIPASAQVIASHSRHNPIKDPPKGYAQIRGGQDTLSIVIFNPFLEIPSAYKPWSGKDVLAAATNRNQPEFFSDCRKKLKELCRAYN